MSTTLQEEIPPGQELKSTSWRPSRGQFVGGLMFVVLLVVLLAAFGSPLWQLLSTATPVLALGVTALLAISMLVVYVAIRTFRHEQAQSMIWLKRAAPGHYGGDRAGYSRRSGGCLAIARRNACHYRSQWPATCRWKGGERLLDRWPPASADMGRFLISTDLNPQAVKVGAWVDFLIR